MKALSYEEQMVRIVDAQHDFYVQRLFGSWLQRKLVKLIAPALFAVLPFIQDIYPGLCISRETQVKNMRAL